VRIRRDRVWHRGWNRRSRWYYTSSRGI
jgi:hypothetical protein